MRGRIQKDYPLYGEVFVKDFTTEEVSEIGIQFRYRPFEGKASKFIQEEQIAGFQTTDEGRMIEVISDFDFKVDYKIRLDTGEYSIQEIGVAEDDSLKYAQYRNRQNRFKKVLVLS